ncbi:MAG: LptF/LptG family permease [Pseudomonadota bacterium]
MRMRTLVLYLNTSMARAILLPLAGLAILALAIELREKAASLVAFGGAEAVLRYALLALPELMVTVAPIALLAGAVLGFAILARRGEAVILRAAGLGTLQISAALLPLGLALGAGLHLLDDRLVPLAEERRAAEFGGLDAEEGEARLVWLRAPGWVIRAEPLNADGTALGAVTVFGLGADGALERRIDARLAEYHEDVWRLSGALETVVGAARSEALATGQATVAWRSALVPEDVRALLGSEHVLSRADAEAAIAGERLATEPRSVYEMRAAHTLSIAATPMVLILLASPVILGSGRSTGALVMATVVAAGLGLAFVMGKGLAVALGEKGLIEPSVAAWAPVLVAILLGLWAVLRAEG